MDFVIYSMSIRNYSYLLIYIGWENSLKALVSVSSLDAHFKKLVRFFQLKINNDHNLNTEKKLLRGYENVTTVPVAFVFISFFWVPSELPRSMHPSQEGTAFLCSW